MVCVILQGLGFEVLAQVVESISPSHVMQLTTFNPNNNLPPDMWWSPEGPPTQQAPMVYQLPSVGALQQNMGTAPSGTLTGSMLGICLKQQSAVSSSKSCQVFHAQSCQCTLHLLSHQTNPYMDMRTLSGQDSQVWLHLLQLQLLI